MTNPTVNQVQSPEQAIEVGIGEPLSGWGLVNASIHLVTLSRNEMWMVASLGLPPGLQEVLRCVTLQEPLPATVAYHSGRRVVDVAQHHMARFHSLKPYRMELDRQGDKPRGIWCEPLFAGGRKVGSLVAEFRLQLNDTDPTCVAAMNYVATTAGLWAASYQFANLLHGPDGPDGNTLAMSARQRSILEGVAEGLTDSEIALRIGFSVATVRHEQSRVRELLQTANRKASAERALGLGLLRSSRERAA